MSPRAIPLLLLFLAVALPAHRIRAEYPTEMAPVDDYLMASPEAEARLALSAAPPDVSRNAGVLVLTRRGYQPWREGSNGFTCLVERSWGTQDSRVFWVPATRAPICYNPEGSATLLQRYLRRSEGVLAGQTQAKIREDEVRAVASGELRPPTRSAMAYMLSAGQYIHPEVGRWKPHLMVWIPYATNADWGDNPLAGDHPRVFRDEGGPLALVVIPVGTERFIDPATVDPAVAGTH